jgi:hypothetical protein
MIAMGIGRFVLTPILPLMQAESGILRCIGGYLAYAVIGDPPIGIALWTNGFVDEPDELLNTNVG